MGFQRKFRITVKWSRKTETVPTTPAPHMHSCLHYQHPTPVWYVPYNWWHHQQLTSIVSKRAHTWCRPFSWVLGNVQWRVLTIRKYRIVSQSLKALHFINSSFHPPSLWQPLLFLLLLWVFSPEYCMVGILQCVTFSSWIFFHLVTYTYVSSMSFFVAL